MDEIERRLLAVEVLLSERLALDPPALLDQLAELVRAWPDKEARAQGLAIIDDSRRRFDEITPGVHLDPP